MHHTGSVSSLSDTRCLSFFKETHVCLFYNNFTPSVCDMSSDTCFLSSRCANRGPRERSYCQLWQWERSQISSMPVLASKERGESLTYLLASQRSDMERSGILLAIAVALCWGSADTVATFATRRQGTFVTTFISLVTSATVLVLFGPLAYARLSLSPVVFVQSAGLGLLTGVMAAVGYFSLYRGLQLGPLAILSPVTAADGAVGAVLAVLFLHDFFSPWQFAMLALVFLGILGASTNIVEVRGIARASGLAGLAAGGVRWGLLAMVTFGVMLFGIGLAAGQWGWYAPILWTRTFAALALFLFAALRRKVSRRPVRPGAASEQKPAPLHAY